MVTRPIELRHCTRRVSCFPYFVLCATLSLLVVTAASQTEDSGTQGKSGQQTPPPLSTQEMAELKAKADSGDAVTEFKLGMAYRTGNGVAPNDEMAYKWIRKAAEQGNADAENILGTMYRLGEGAPRDREEAVRWYQKAARGGSAKAMFNLATCHYNGDGVGSNEYTAYVWFLLAQESGDAAARDAVKRSAATMTKNDNAEAYFRLAEMYRKGDEIPKDDQRSLQWLRKAADLGPAGKVLLAGRLIRDGENNYPQAMALCKDAAGDYHPAQRCVGYLYRHGLGVPKDSAEALKWYRKAAGVDKTATVELAEMYTTGEGTKADRPEAFILYVQAGTLGATESFAKALSLWQQMNSSERKKVEDRLKAQRLDPKKVIAALSAPGKQ